MRRMDLIRDCLAWHQAAVPEPTDASARVQLGCHLEEVAEMQDVVGFQWHDLPKMEQLADYKPIEAADLFKSWTPDLTIHDREKFVDALADQMVTLIGVAHHYGIDIYKAFQRVNESNWSKFEEGKPVFDENGKIKKGRHYRPANLSDL